MWRGYVDPKREAGKLSSRSRKGTHRATEAWSDGCHAADVRGKGTGKCKSETRYCYDCGEQGHVGVNCSYKWTNSKDEEDDQGSSWESESEGDKADERASLEALDDDGEWCWPRRNRITR